MKLKRENIVLILVTAGFLCSLVVNLIQGWMIQNLNRRLDNDQIRIWLEGTNTNILFDAIYAQADVYESCVRYMAPKTVNQEDLLRFSGYIDGKTMPYESRHLVSGAGQLPPYTDVDTTVFDRFFQLDRKLVNCLPDLSDEQMKQLVPHYEALILLLHSNGRDSNYSLLEMLRPYQLGQEEYPALLQDINARLDAIEEVLDRTVI